MRNISTELKVGTTVLAAVAVLFIGIIWAKDYTFNAERYRYSVLFPNIGTLEPGDPVSVLGVKKGQVEKIEIAGNSVLVTFKITNDVSLKKDARFTVMNIGLMGERLVNIEPGTSPEPLDLASPGRGLYDSGIPEVMGTAGAAIGELRQLIKAFEGTIGTPEAAASMKQIVANLEKITGDWQTITEQNRGKMTQAIDDMASSSAHLKDILDGNGEALTGTINNLSEGSEKFLALADRLDSLSYSAHGLLDGLNDGQGSIGRAIKSDSLYAVLLTATSNLDSLICDFRANPKKYVKLSIF